METRLDPSLVALFVAEREFLPGEDAAWMNVRSIIRGGRA
jgi:hypothetical protein